MVLRLSAFLLAASLAKGAEFSTENERLVAASRLWVTVEFLHPYVAEKKVDWNAAFVLALPKLRAASTREEYSAALNFLLDQLHDPCTYVLPASEELRKANGVDIMNGPSILDLRRNDGYSEMLDEPSVRMFFINSPLDAPAQRTVLRTAFATSFVVKPGIHLERNAGATGVKGRKATSVFVLGENSRLPEIGAAMAAARQVSVLSESPHFQIAGVDTVTMDLIGVKAIVRLSEPEIPIPFQVVSASEIDKRAMSLLGKEPLPWVDEETAVTPVKFEEPYPNAEARILAAAKSWGTIRYFFAYKDLIDEDWDDIFAQYLPKFIAARDAREYNLTLCDMLTHLTDSNTFASSKTLNSYFGEASVGLRLRMLEKHPVVVAVLDPAAAEAGVKPGDIIKHVDGESVVERFNNRVQYVPASTSQRSSYDTLQRILNGPAGSKVTLEMETPTGESKSVTLERSHAFESAPQRTNDAVRLLNGNIGYIDLDRVSKDEAEKAMRQFQSARELILDLRGKAASADVIAAHLVAQPNTPSAIVTTPMVLHPDVVTDSVATQTASTFVVQTLRAPALPGFKGKAVALIDERTIGESEQAGLMFEAAAKIEFIGTPSAGADSELATFALPGGVTVSYSARDIRHANGGKLQRLGLQPSELAFDTAKTIRDGRDQALESARAYLTR